MPNRSHPLSHCYNLVIIIFSFSPRETTRPVSQTEQNGRIARQPHTLHCKLNSDMLCVVCIAACVPHRTQRYTHGIPNKYSNALRLYTHRERRSTRHLARTLDGLLDVDSVCRRNRKSKRERKKNSNQTELMELKWLSFQPFAGRVAENRKIKVSQIVRLNYIGISAINYLRGD